MAKLKIAEQYGVVPNSVLHDSELSLKAKGLYGYIQSKPDGWEFSAERIMTDCKDGLDSVRAGLRELESSGYLSRKKTKDESGLFEYEYELRSQKATVENPTVENPTLDKPPVEKPPYNKERDTKKELVKKNNSPKGEGEAPETYGKESVNEIIRAYVETNGILEGSEKENRRYAHLLSKKLDAIKGFDGRYYELVTALISNPGKYEARYASSPKETYYNLAKLVAAKRSESRGIQSF